MELVLIILIVLILCGGGGWWYYGRGAPAGPGFNPIGIIVIVVVLLLLFGLLGGSRLGWYHW